jgi:hypothetical protein
MSQRAEQLQATADRQIVDLLDLVRTTSGETLRQPCPGREKLGDGSVGAFLAHTTDNYQRIGEFAAAGDRMSNGHGFGGHARGGLPRFLRAIRHQRPSHDHSVGAHESDDPYSAGNVALADLAARLSNAREQLARIAALEDRQLDTIPPKDSFRFCDGQRTLEQVLTGLLKHQAHQLETMHTVLGRTP